MAGIADAIDTRLEAEASIQGTAAANQNAKNQFMDAPQNVFTQEEVDRLRDPMTSANSALGT